MNIVFLVGLPASGKSTWLKNNQTLFKNYKILSSDNYIEKIAKSQNKTYDEVFKDHIKDSDNHFWNELKSSLNNKENIFIDRTNLSKKSRNKILSQVPQEYKKHAIIFEIDPEEQNKRLKSRKDQEGKSIPEDILKQMSKSYQEPTKDEGFDSITKGL